MLINSEEVGGEWSGYPAISWRYSLLIFQACETIVLRFLSTRYTGQWHLSATLAYKLPDTASERSSSSMQIWIAVTNSGNPRYLPDSPQDHNTSRMIVSFIAKPPLRKLYDILRHNLPNTTNHDVYDNYDTHDNYAFLQPLFGSLGRLANTLKVTHFITHFWFLKQEMAVYEENTVCKISNNVVVKYVIPQIECAIFTKKYA